MNRQRLIQLREQLQNLPGKFDYNSYAYLIDAEGERNRSIDLIISHPCETHACVAGWCMLLNNTDTGSVRYASFSSQWSAEFLELTPDERLFLFYPWEANCVEGFTGRIYSDVMNYGLEDALDRIDHLLSRP
jgi:hypothetical protein